MARSAAIVSLCIVVSVAAIYGAYRWRYYRALRIVEAGLDDIPRITYAISGHHDDEDLTYNVDGVTINVGGDPNKRIELYGVGKHSFDGTDALWIHRFGHLTFEWTSFRRDPTDSDGWSASAGSSGLDIGVHSRFVSILPMPRDVRTIRDLVTNYDELLAAMDQWPRRGSVPFSADVELRYYIEDDRDLP